MGEEKRVTRDGKTYRWRTSHNKKGRCTRSSLAFDLCLPVGFSIEEEKVLHRLTKWMGFATEFQTGDSQFDRHLYLMSDAPHFCARLVEDEVLRKRLLGLFRVGKRVEGNARKGWIRVHWRTPESIPDPNTAESMVESLLEIAKRLATLSPHASTMDRVRGNLCIAWVGLSIALPIVASFLLVVLPYRAVEPSGIFFQSLPYWFVSVIVALGAIRVLFVGSSYGFKALKYFALCGVIGLAFASYDVLYYLNYKRDTGPQTIHKQTILGKYTSGRRNTAKNIRVAPWRTDQSSFSLVVDKATYNNAQPGGSMRITVRPGYLGHEWVERYELID